MSNNDDFSKKLDELDEIVEWFDADSTDIDESIKKFERGLVLAEELKKSLSDVENKVEKIKSKYSK